MKHFIKILVLGVGMATYGIEWEMRNYDIIDPASLWDIYTYSQQDADNHEDIPDALVGQVWWMQYNPKYALDESNSIVLALDLWAKHGWFSLVWIDGETGEQHRLADSKGAEGEGYYRLTVHVDKNHPLAEKLLSGDGTLTSVQMINREMPKPEYGTWYAGRYHVDILDWSVEDPKEPDVEPIPPDTPEPGFATRPRIDIDTGSGTVTFSFELLDGGGQGDGGGAASGYAVFGTTNLVSGEWFHIADGFSATVESVEDNMFIRLGYEEG